MPSLPWCCRCAELSPDSGESRSSSSGRQRHAQPDGVPFFSGSEHISMRFENGKTWLEIDAGWKTTTTTTTTMVVERDCSAQIIHHRHHDYTGKTNVANPRRWSAACTNKSQSASVWRHGRSQGFHQIFLLQFPEWNRFFSFSRILYLFLLINLLKIIY